MPRTYVREQNAQGQGRSTRKDLEADLIDIALLLFTQVGHIVDR